MRRFVFPAMVAWLVLTGCTPACAGDPAAPAPEGGSLWVYLLSSEAVWNVVGTLLAILLAVLTRTAWVQRAKAAMDSVDAELYKTVEAAAIKTYYSSVKGVKEMAADGKITKAEVKAKAVEWRDEAYQTAKDLAAGPAKDALIKLARPAFDAMLEKVIGKMKRENSTPA